MSTLTYKVLHLVGALALFLSLGGLVALKLAPSGSSQAATRLFRAMHGVALLLLLVAGFGLMARLQILSAWPAWIWVKLGVWVALGGLVALLRRGEAAAHVLWIVFLALGGIAVWAVLVRF
jgi:uncharacterized membrane protein SirB2